MVLLVCAGFSSEAQTSSQAELHAAYLYNFAKYIKWPQDPDKYTIGALSDDETMEILQNTLKEKRVGGKEIVLKRIIKVEEVIECQIVYLSESNSKKLDQVKAISKEKSVLIVTEEDLIKKGASISFVVEDDRLRFKLKKSALQDAGLIPSDGLLKLAIVF